MSIWKEPRPTVRQPWYRRLLCLFSHDWTEADNRKTGSWTAVTVYPMHEYEAEYVCKRCLRTKWEGHHYDTLAERLWPEEHPYNEQGIPCDKDGKQLPRARGIPT